MSIQLQVQELFKKKGFRAGRLLSYSKSIYLAVHPDNEVYFNANVYSDSGKVWHGDLDLTLDSPVLIKIAKEAKCKLYVLPEFAGRFLDKPLKELLKLAVKTYK